MSEDAKIRRSRVFRTPFVTCPTCHGAGRLSRLQRVEMREPIRLARSFQAVVFDPCPKCVGSGRTFNGLAADLAELFYAAVRPYLKTIRAALAPIGKPPIKTTWRERAAGSWRYARLESMAQIARLAQERKDRNDAS